MNCEEQSHATSLTGARTTKVKWNNLSNPFNVAFLICTTNLHIDHLWGAHNRFGHASHFSMGNQWLSLKQLITRSSLGNVCVCPSGPTIELCETPSIEPFNGNAITRWLSGPIVNLFTCKYEASLYVKMSSNKSIKVTFIECFMSQSRSLQWAGMRVEGQEKGGGLVNQALQPHNGWGMFLVQPSSVEKWASFLCLVEFIAAVKNCSEVACGWWSESANQSRPDLALLCCWALWESVSLLRGLQGPVG